VIQYNIFLYLVDDNPEKHFRFSPGHHLPVLPPNIIYDSNAQIVVILAWQYSSDIINKHKRFLEKGGTFIVPLPEIKAVTNALM